MSKKLIKLILAFGLILILAACTGSQPAPTSTSAPPAAVETEEATATDAGEDQTQDDAAAEDQESEDEASTDDQEAEEETSAPAIDAAAIFAENCARCHGADRVSGRAPDLIPDNLTKDRQVYIDTITNGSGPMPTFESKLSAEEINALVDFVLSAP